jgi:N-acetylglucosamine kinase-like BadF-type ATPase
VPHLVLGVDGGNTKTVALVANFNGEIVGVGRAGCADIYGAPTPGAAVTEVGRAVAAAIRAAGAVPADVAHAVFSLAGADWPEDKADLRAAVQPLVPAARSVAVVNDAIGALWAGTSDGVGVSVVCGTGGCVGARASDGHEWHSGWWAFRTGAWAIGADALDAVYLAELGIGPPTSLTERALDVFDAPSVEEILHSFTRRGGRSAFETAQLAPAVLEDALAGDEVARAVAVGQGAALGDIAGAAARIVGLDGLPHPLVLLGGMLRGDGAELFVAEIIARVPGGQPAQPRLEPVAGPLLMALDAAGVRVDETRIRETFPPSHLFATADLSAISDP